MHRHRFLGAQPGRGQCGHRILDGKVHLADITDPARPQVQGWMQASTDNDAINSLAFSPDGRTLVSAAYDDQTFSLWNVADSRHPASLGSPVDWLNNGVYSASFSSEGPVLATADHDGTVSCGTSPIPLASMTWARP